MPVKFNIVERANPSNRQAPTKYYPSLHSSGRVTTQELAEMAADRSTLTTADMMAAIETILSIIPLQLKKGNVVELGDFGSFWLKSSSDGADSIGEVSPNQITSLLPRFIPGKRFRMVLKTVEYTRGTVMSEPVQQTGPVNQ
jgi:predicted histone-like DNA-binding protein